MAAALWLVTLPSSPPPTYDTQWQLLWGEQLARGELPFYGSGPTVHPLIVALSSVLSLLSFGNDSAVDEAMRALSMLAFVSIAGMCAFVAHRIAGTAAALLVALLVLTRPFIFQFAYVSYFDVIFAALCLGGFLVARADRLTTALCLFAAAGLIRPEAWLFGGGLVALGWYRGSRRMIPLVLATAAPVAWVCFDFVITGKPLYSFTNTSSAAAALGRDRGPLDALLLGPVRAGQLVGPEVAALMICGFVVALRRRRSSFDATWLLLISVAGFGGYLVANSFGTSILSRYLLFPTMAAMPFIAFLIPELTGREARNGLPPRLKQGVLLIVIAVAGVTVTLGLREIGTNLPAAQQEARDDDSVRAALGLVADCSAIETNDFFVAAVVARELDLSPALVTLQGPGSSVRPPRTELIGTSRLRARTSGGILVRRPCPK